MENTERFGALALFQGRAKVSASSIGSGEKITEDDDPTLFCAAFKKNRFYLFSRREPDEPDEPDAPGRDVFNEKPSKEDLALAEREARGPLPRQATINTSYGEVRLKLFPDECPKTVENFATHAQNGCAAEVDRCPCARSAHGAGPHFQWSPSVPPDHLPNMAGTTTACSSTG